MTDQRCTSVCESCNVVTQKPSAFVSPFVVHRDVSSAQKQEWAQALGVLLVLNTLLKLMVWHWLPCPQLIEI